jgi:UDP-2,3-diacylglucosamine hydrolase
MSFTYFISDIHLDPKQVSIVEKFLSFLKNEATQADALYILGDLFEAWIGDDDDSAFATQIKSALRLVSTKIPVYFIHGNRDFIVGQQFAAETGITILPEVSVINLYGRSVLLMHGDLLCIDDTQYQAFRKKVHSPQFQKKLLRLPLFVRRLIAAYARYRSKQHTSTTNLMIQDVTPTEVRRYFTTHSVPLLIHGHTHRPAEHTVELDGHTGQRIVLAAWHDHGEALKLDDQGKHSRYQF